MIDEKRFFESYLSVTEGNSTTDGIGTLSEKTLHKILKKYYEPREEMQEISFMGYVCDVKNEEGIIEIQTGSFAPLYKKLKKLLSYSKVTLVHPIIAEKNLIWIDKETGEMTEPKRSPKKGRFSDVLPELYRLSDLLFSEGLTVRLLLITADEYKYLDGYGKDRKKRATKVERIPKRLLEEKDIKGLDDLKDLLPALPTPFTSKDFNKATRLKGRRAFFALKLVERLGVAEKCGKDKNAYLYKLTVENEN